MLKVTKVEHAKAWCSVQRIVGSTQYIIYSIEYPVESVVCRTVTYTKYIVQHCIYDRGAATIHQAATRVGPKHPDTA